MNIKQGEIHTEVALMELIQDIGFLPLLDSGIPGYCAEALVDEECRYVVYPDGGWDWPLWKWKGSIITESDCVYGKFFAGKACFISRKWWPDFCNYRRNLYPKPEEGSIEDIILETLRMNGSLITRELRAACRFTGPKMRSRFDTYITRLQMATRIVTEDFVYPHDKHNRPYGWGWSLLTTPEQLYGYEACISEHTPEESFNLLFTHLRQLLPQATDQQILKLLN
ncbi:MAG: hypothetical protein J6Y84_02100 [Bacteroidaceae bacterium]|nr:hypothetical protein [Bacteroidaceae bacterium]